MMYQGITKSVAENPATDYGASFSLRVDQLRKWSHLVTVLPDLRMVLDDAADPVERLLRIQQRPLIDGPAANDFKKTPSGISGRRVF
jgi:hypothetical protein